MHWQGGLKEATEVAGDLEVLTKDLIAPQVFSLHAAGDIVEQFPEKENKCKAIVIALCLPTGKCSGVDNNLLGQKSPIVGFPIYQFQEGQFLAIRYWELYGWGPSFAQV